MTYQYSCYLSSSFLFPLSTFIYVPFSGWYASLSRGPCALDEACGLLTKMAYSIFLVLYSSLQLFIQQCDKKQILLFIPWKTLSVKESS